MTAKLARERQQRWRQCLASLPGHDRFWCYSRKPRPDDPCQGWKLHLSATLLSADEVFSRAWPVLAGHDAYFKVAAHLDFVAQLNAGLTEFSQVGKFITIYPRSTEEAVALARELHAATRGLAGPRIPFDARYRKNSLVYYRYGSFRARSKNGTGPGSVTDPEGKSHLDKRAPGCAVPRWLKDPFAKPQSRALRTTFGGPLAPDYLPFRAISQRGKGGVYEAIDLSVSPARRVIVKEGRRHGETTWDGEDGYARLKREGLVLRTLRRSGIPVPAGVSGNGSRRESLSHPRKNYRPTAHSTEKAASSETLLATCAPTSRAARRTFFATARCGLGLARLQTFARFSATWWDAPDRLRGRVSNRRAPCISVGIAELFAGVLPAAVSPTAGDTRR